MNDPKLFMVLIGCRPPGRAVEQHDIFFGIAGSIGELVPAIIAYWPEAKGKIHIDAWRAVACANGYKVRVAHKPGADDTVGEKLYFINLGGYKPGEFEEYHYKMVIAAPGITEAIKLARQTAFYKHTGYKGAVSHIDDKYGIDVDDAALISDILQKSDRLQYRLILEPHTSLPEDELHIGYFKLDSL
jgi:hypothetical protein